MTECARFTPFRASRHSGRSSVGREVWMSARVSLLTILLAGTVHAQGAGECVVPGDNSNGTDYGLPSELAGKSMTLLLDENFDNQDDWQVRRAGVCEGDRSHPDCATIPDKWTHFYSNERFHPDDLNDSSFHPSLQISDFAPRGGSGKSLVLFDESYGSPSQWGSDGVLSMQMDDFVPDLYAEFWVKFQPGWRWMSLEDGSGQDYAKLARISSFTGENQDARFKFFSGGQNHPIVFIGLTSWEFSGSTPGNRTMLNSTVRCSPDPEFRKCQDVKHGGDAQLPGQPSWSESFGDGNWHKVAWRQSMNSAPGALDGVLQIWFDGQLIFENNKIPFANEGSIHTAGFNTFMIGGNMHNYPEPEANRFEQWISYDDIRLFKVVD